MIIKPEQFKKIFPLCKNHETLVSAMNTLLPKYQITTKIRIASFLAQCGHESGGWRVFSENLNYSSEALLKVFGKYFKNLQATKVYARNPTKIANLVYANRMGNGDYSSGDGWKYRGRGPIQLTGKYNYTAFSTDSGIDVVSSPDLLSDDPSTALLSALWFWEKNKLNALSDTGDIMAVTKKINGGYNGLEDRTEYYKLCLRGLD